MIQPISLSQFFAVFNNTYGRVRYQFGAKAPNLYCDTALIHSIDCSGFTRYITARATNELTIIPDGHYYQHEWCIRMGLHKLAQYSDVAYAANDPSRLFMCFIEPNAHESIGHVWFVCAGETYEAHSPVGVSSRPWNTSVLTTNVAASFEFPAQP